MKESSAIKLHCVGCADETTLDVTLCGINDCPLWEHLLGCPPQTRQYQERINKAVRSHPALIEDLSGRA